MLVEINLLPEELRIRPRAEKRRSFQVPRFVPLLVVGLVLLIGVISFAIIAYTGSVASTLKAAKTQLKNEQTRAARAITIQTEMPELQERASIVVGRVTEKIYWWEVLDQITRCCPSNVILESVRVQYDSVLRRPSTLILSGSYQDSTGVEINFTRNLQSSQRLAKYIDKIYPGQTTVMGERTLFTVKCSFVQPEKPKDTGEEEE